MPRRIVFINQATGYLTIDIINAFADEFEYVALIAGSIRVQDIELNKKVKWTRIARYDRGNPAKKLISWLWATIQILFLLLFRFRHYEVFYITVPPTAYLLSLLLPNKFSILVFDIYPESLKIYNIKDSSWIFRLWAKWNRGIFKKAHRIFTIGDGMKSILANYVNHEKILVINNWSGLIEIKPIPKDSNPFIKAQSLSGKFIIEYSGNIGYTHNVETLLEVAERFKDDTQVVFLIIGRGERFNNIKDLIHKNQLNNCRLLPFQPDSEIQNSLSAANLSIVILDERVATYSIPSKTYNLLALGSAFLVIGSPEAELAKFVANFKIGKTFSQVNIPGMVEFIKELKEDPGKIDYYKNNALKVAGYFTYQNARKYLEYYK
jgi:glycosyltransferase involved in cell wall biosynthesis